MGFSAKQREFLDNADHRWNIKAGATRSGKTYLDYYVIPMRIKRVRGLPGLIVLLGNTKGTLQRNVIDPLQEMYGTGLVSSIRSDNTAMLFGEKCYCLGADNKKHVDRIRGMSIKYAYGDEVATWEEEVFEMLKSRLDREYSRFDGTCNPKEPEHWLKQFIDSDADVFYQQYGIDDNPFLPDVVKTALKSEHKGVFYNRYILGEWCVAEGLVFPYFGEDSSPFLIDSPPVYRKKVKSNEPDVSAYAKISIGLDFGGTGSLNTMVAVGIGGNYDTVTVLQESCLPRGDRIDTERIANACADFCASVREQYGRYDFVFYDAADPALGNRVAAVLQTRGLPSRNVVASYKVPLEERPVTVDGLLCSGRLKINKTCMGVIRALSQLRWDEAKPNIPEDKNIGNINDYWDAFCYAWSAWWKYFDRRAYGREKG